MRLILQLKKKTRIITGIEILTKFDTTKLKLRLTSFIRAPLSFYRVLLGFVSPSEQIPTVN